MRAAALALCAAAALSLAPVSARAEALHLDPALDAVLLGTGAVLGLSMEIISESGELEPQAPGDIDDVNPIDRWVARGSSSGTRAPNQVSNILFAIALAGAVGLPLAAGIEMGSETGWSDLVLCLEALAWNTALVNLVKLAVRRPRPIAYIQIREGSFDPDRTDGAVSFYSGHTSTVASVAAALTTIEMMRRPPGCPRPWLTLVAGAALTITTGALRVAAKRHFVTDVTVGAVMGTAVGVAVPLLHRSGPRVVPAVALVPGGASVGVSGVL